MMLHPCACHTRRQNSLGVGDLFPALRSLLSGAGTDPSSARCSPCLQSPTGRRGHHPLLPRVHPRPPPIRITRLLIRPARHARLPLLNRLETAEMAGPSWLAGIFATLMLVTAGYCTSRLAAARRWQRATEHDVDLMHAVMGVAMAGMLVPQLNLLRHGAWEIVFAAATAWFGWQVIRSRRGRPADRHPPADPLPHLLACAPCSTCSSRQARQGPDRG